MILCKISARLLFAEAYPSDPSAVPMAIGRINNKWTGGQNHTVGVSTAYRKQSQNEQPGAENKKIETE